MQLLQIINLKNVDNKPNFCFEQLIIKRDYYSKIL